MSNTNQGFAGQSSQSQYPYYNNAQAATYQQNFIQNLSPSRYTNTFQGAANTTQFSQFYPSYQTAQQQFTAEQYQYAYQQFQQQQRRLQATQYQTQQVAQKQNQQQSQKSNQNKSNDRSAGGKSTSGTTNAARVVSGANGMIGDAVTITANMLNPSSSSQVPDSYLTLARGLNTTYRVVLSKTRVFKFAPRKMLASDNKQSKVTPTAMYFISRLCEHSPHLVKDLQYLVGLRCMFCENAETYASGSTNFISAKRPDSVNLLVIAIQRMRQHMLTCPGLVRAAKIDVTSLIGAEMPSSVLAAFFQEWHQLIAVNYPARSASAAFGLGYIPPASFAELDHVPDEIEMREELVESIEKSRRVVKRQYAISEDLTDLPFPHGKMSSPFVEQLLQNCHMLATHNPKAKSDEFPFHVWIECRFCKSQGDQADQSSGDRRYVQSITSPTAENSKSDSDWFASSFVCHHELCKSMPSRVRKTMRKYSYDKIHERLPGWIAEHFLMWSSHINENVLPQCEPCISSKYIHDADLFKPLTMELMKQYRTIGSKTPINFKNPVGPVHLEPESSFGPHDVIFGSEFYRDYIGNRRFRQLICMYRDMHFERIKAGKLGAALFKDVRRKVMRRGGNFYRHSPKEEPPTTADIHDYIKYCFDYGFVDLMRPPVDRNIRKPGSYVYDMECAPKFGVLHGRLQWSGTPHMESDRLFGDPPNDKLATASFEDPIFTGGMTNPPANSAPVLPAKPTHTLISSVPRMASDSNAAAAPQSRAAAAPASHLVSTNATSVAPNKSSVSDHSVPAVPQQPIMARTADNAAQVAAAVNSTASHPVSRDTLVNRATNSIQASSSVSKAPVAPPRSGLGIGQKTFRVVAANSPKPGSSIMPSKSGSAITSNQISTGKKLILETAKPKPTTQQPVSSMVEKSSTSQAATLAGTATAQVSASVAPTVNAAKTIDPTPQTQNDPKELPAVGNSADGDAYPLSSGDPATETQNYPNKLPAVEMCTDGDAQPLASGNEGSKPQAPAPVPGSTPADDVIELVESSDSDDEMSEIPPELANISNRMLATLPSSVRRKRKRILNNSPEPSKRVASATPPHPTESPQKTPPKVIPTSNRSESNSSPGTPDIRNGRGLDAPGHRGIPKSKKSGNQADRKEKGSLPTTMKEIYTNAEEDVHSTITEPEDASAKRREAGNAASAAAAAAIPPAAASTVAVVAPPGKPDEPDLERKPEPTPDAAPASETTLAATTTRPQPLATDPSAGAEVLLIDDSSGSM